MDSVDNVNEKEYSKAIAAAILYGSTSFSVAFINKALMTSYVFDFPVIIMVMRMFFTVIILHVLRMLQLIQISGYTFSKGKSFAVPSMLYGLNSVLGLNALSHMKRGHVWSRQAMYSFRYHAFLCSCFEKRFTI